MSKQHDKQFKLDAVRYYQEHNVSKTTTALFAY